MAWIYFLKSDSGKYYIGSTTDLKSRLHHHQHGFTPSTKRLGHVELVFSQEYTTLKDARRIVAKLKRMKRKDYIDKIISDGFLRMV